MTERPGTTEDGGPTPAPAYRGSGLGFRTRLTLGLVAAAVLPLATFGIVVLLVTGIDADSTRVPGPAARHRRRRRRRRAARGGDRSRSRGTPPGDRLLGRPGLGGRSRDAAGAARGRRVQPPRREPQPAGARPPASQHGAAPDPRRARVDRAPRAARGDRRPVRARRASRVRHDRLRAAPARPARDPDRGGRPRRADPGPGTAHRRGRGARDRHGAPAGDAPLGARRPGPVRAVRDRGQRGDPERRSCTRGSRTRTAACSSSTRRRTTSCAACRTTSRRRSRASAATPSSWRRSGPIAGSGSSPSRPTDSAGWSASCSTVSRIESGALRPRQDVVAPALRVQRAWEALGAADVPFRLDDESAGLARGRGRRPAGPGPVGDPRQRREVRQPGGRRGARSRIDRETSRLAITITDAGPGVREADRDRLFRRFERGTERPSGEGSGLGLYVSRELCRAMDGDLVLDPREGRRRRLAHDHAPRGGTRGVVAGPPHWAGRYRRVPGPAHKPSPCGTSARSAARSVYDRRRCQPHHQMSPGETSMSSLWPVWASARVRRIGPRGCFRIST